MKKRNAVISILLAAAMACGMFAGCGSDSSNDIY